MKTLSTIIIKSSIIVTAVSLFFLTSCSKEELKAPAHSERADIILKQTGPNHGPNATIYGNEHMPVAANKIEPPKYGFNSIKIEHKWQTNAPDYSVTIRYDGWVIFEGRKNCAYNHLITFYVPYENVSRLQNLYLNTNFFEISDNLQFLKELPGISTTCTNLGDELTSKTLVDFNKGYPAVLINFRMRTESLMNITQYVGYEN